MEHASNIWYEMLLMFAEMWDSACDCAKPAQTSGWFYALLGSLVYGITLAIINYYSSKVRK